LPEAGETVPLPDGLTPVVSRYDVLKLAVYEVVAAAAVTECESAKPSDQPAKVYWVPAERLCGEVVAMVCWLPTCQVTATGAGCGAPLSTLTASPDGEVTIVTLTLFTTKFAVSFTGPDMVTIRGLVELLVVPVQLEKL